MGTYPLLLASLIVGVFLQQHELWTLALWGDAVASREAMSPTHFLSIMRAWCPQLLKANSVTFFLPIGMGGKRTLTF